MRVTVRLFARLREIAGAAEMAREVAPGATIGGVWRQLAREFPALGTLRALDFERGQRRLRADGHRASRGRRGRVPAAGIWRMTFRQEITEPTEMNVFLSACSVHSAVSLILCSTNWPLSSSSTKALMQLLGTAEVQSDSSDYRKHAKTLSEIEPIVQKFREYKAVSEEVAQTEELASAGEPTCASSRSRS